MMPHHRDLTERLNPSLPARQPEHPDTCQTATVLFCGRLPYEEAWTLQRVYRAQRAQDGYSDLLLLMEHEPVFTAGRTTQDRHWPGGERITQKTGIPVIRTERGGSITYHGPGQVVGYPILRLSDHCPGPKAYVHRLEEVLITTLSEWGIVAHRRERLPGVWVGADSPSKIAFIGVRISQGITTHGFALNVAMDLAPFSHIVPCGIADCRVTSMATLLGITPDMHIIQQRIATVFAERFHLTWTQGVGPQNSDSLMEPPTIPLVTSPIQP